MRIPIGWMLAIEKGRFLVLSRFPAASRRMTAALAEQLSEDLTTIDHGFSFPLRYFEVHHLFCDLCLLPNEISVALISSGR
jgi:hypothetical protein